MRWKRRSSLRIPLDRHTRSLLGLVLFVGGILLLLTAAPFWFWRTLIGMAAAWWGWKLFTNP